MEVYNQLHGSSPRDLQRSGNAIHTPVLAAIVTVVQVLEGILHSHALRRPRALRLAKSASAQLRQHHVDLRVAVVWIGAWC